MVQTLELFTCRSADRWDYANFVVVQRYDPDRVAAGGGGYFMLAIESSYGTGYAFAWTHPGGDFYDFLRTVDQWYACGKFCPGDKAPSWEATSEAIRREICVRRRRAECTAEEARAAWPESLFESEYDYASWNNEQEFLSDAHEYIVQVPGPRARDFLALYKAFWPAFCEQLMVAKAQRQAVRENLKAMQAKVEQVVDEAMAAANMRLG